MTDTVNSCELKENVNPTKLYKSKHPGRLLPTASTFGQLANYGGEVYRLPLIGENKKGCFASGKYTFAPLKKKMILGSINRANSY